MLRFKKTKEKISSTRDEELVQKDYQKEITEQFESEISKIMDISDGEDLNEDYLGKKKLESMTSKGNLARILETYNNSDEEEKEELKVLANENTIESMATLPEMSPAMSVKSLEPV